MRCHLQIQNWDLMLVSDIKTKWLRFNADLVEIFCPLARLKRPLAKKWISRRIVVMQKQKKRFLKKFLLTRSQEHWDSNNRPGRFYTRSLRCSRAVHEQNVVESAISNPKAFVRYVGEGTKKRDPIPGLRRLDGSIDTNFSQSFSNCLNT